MSFCCFLKGSMKSTTIADTIITKPVHHVIWKSKNEFQTGSCSTTNTFELVPIGIGIGKDVFHLIDFDDNGERVLRKKIKRSAPVATLEKLPRYVVGIKAYLSAHFVSRTLRKLGFELRIILAKNTKPFLEGQKNDYL